MPAPTSAPKITMMNKKVEMAEASDFRIPLRFRKRANGSIMRKIITARKIGVAILYR
jgi:hypothetical protein